MIITDTILYKIVTYTKINRILTKTAYYIVNERVLEKPNFADGRDSRAQKVFRFSQEKDNKRRQ